MKKLEWLEAMRGAAAVWVLLHHAAQAVRDFASITPWPAVLNGYLGVNFFFVLSGFIIAYSSRQLVASARGFRDYATARAIRIYVPYLPIGLAMLALYASFPALSRGTRAELSVVSSVFLLPASAPPALSVAWTLVHEILFYAVFSLFFWSPRALVAVLALWCGTIIGAWAGDANVGWFSNYLLSPVNLCFVLGVGLAWATGDGLERRIGVAAAFAGMVLVVCQAGRTHPNEMLVTIGFACLVAASRSQFAIARSPGPALILLGAASYAIYLVHNPVISVGIRIARTLGAATAFAATIGLALVAGIAYHLFYERTALRWARARWMPSNAPGTCRAAIAADFPAQVRETGEVVDRSGA